MEGVGASIESHEVQLNQTEPRSSNQKPRGFGLLTLETVYLWTWMRLHFPRQNWSTVCRYFWTLLKDQLTAVAKRSLKDHLVCQLQLFLGDPDHSHS